MISLLIWVLLICLIFGLVWWVLSLIPLPPPARTIAQVIIAVILLLILLNAIGLLGPPDASFRLPALR